MLRNLALLSLLSAGVAHADGPPEAPAPLLLPELDGHSHVSISIAPAITEIPSMHVDVGGTIALTNNLQIFGTLSLRGTATFNHDFPVPDAKGALGNLRLGARYLLRAGDLTVAPAVSAWVPTHVGDLDDWGVLALMNGLADGRAFLGEGGVGFMVDVAWRHGPSFIQAEAGVAMVIDSGPQVDNLVGSFGVGRQVSRCTSLLAEWRFELHPPGTLPSQLLQVPGVGLGRGDLTRTRWRLRLHPVIEPAREVFGLVIGFDISHRFE